MSKSGKNNKKILALFHKGTAPRGIAQQCKVPIARVYSELEKHYPRGVPRLHGIKRSELRKLWKSGLTAPQIAKKTGLPHHRVTSVLSTYKDYQPVLSTAEIRSRDAAIRKMYKTTRVPANEIGALHDVTANTVYLVTAGVYRQNIPQRTRDRIKKRNEALFRDYKAKMPLKKMGKKHKLAEKTISNIVRSIADRQVRLTRSQRARNFKKAATLYKKGKPSKQVLALVGTSHQTFYEYLQKHNIKRRKRNFRP